MLGIPSTTLSNLSAIVILICRSMRSPMIPMRLVRSAATIWDNIIPSILSGLLAVRLDGSTEFVWGSVLCQLVISFGVLSAMTRKPSGIFSSTAMSSFQIGTLFKDNLIITKI